MEQLAKRVSSLLAAALIAAGCLAFAGCSSGNSSSAESSSSSSSSESSEASLSVESEKGMLVLGEQTATAVNVVFANETGSQITNFAVMPAGSVDEPTLLMKEDEKVAASEKFSVFTEPAGESLFDAVVICGDKSFTLHNLNFNTLDEATIRLEGDVAYIETIVDGNAISSLREEYDRAHPVEAEAVPEPVVEEQPVVEEPAYQEPVYEQPAATTTEAPAATPAPAQSEDSCVSDVVLR